MAYPCTSSTRVPYFSSANARYGGVPTGTPTADNVAVLQQTHYSVANFVLGAPTAPVPAPAPGSVTLLVVLLLTMLAVHVASSSADPSKTRREQRPQQTTGEATWF